MKLFRALLVPLLCAGLAGGPALSQTAGESVAAVVNDTPISTFDVRQRLRLLMATTGVQPDEQTMQRLQQQALRSLIDEQLQLQEAAGDPYNIEIPKSDVDDAIGRLARQNNVDADRIYSDLREAGINPETLRTQIRAELAWQTLVNGRYSNRIRVSDNQVDLARERIMNSLSKPRYLIAEIFLPVESAQEEGEVRRQVESMIQQLMNGAEFQALAQQYSAAASAESGGDAGWMLSGELQPEVERVLQSMEPGRVSPPIRVPGGFYLVALRDERSGAVTQQVTLKSVTAPSDQAGGYQQAAAALSAAAEGKSGCDAAEEIAGEIDGAFATDLGSLSNTSLQADIRNDVDTLDVGGITAPRETSTGAQVYVLCDRQQAVEGLPSRVEIENQLMNQQQSMLSRRYLRDVRRSSTVDVRL